MTTKAAVHVHHFVLGDPVAGRIDGRCRDCPAERSWPAYVGPMFDTSRTSPVQEARRAARVREAELRRDPDAVEWELE